MEMSALFANTLRFINSTPIEQREAEANTLLESWKHHIVLEDSVDFSWVVGVPSLADHTALKTLLTLTNPLLIVFKDYSGTVLGGAGDNTNVAMEISVEMMQEPTTMAILCMSSEKLRDALIKTMQDT